MIPRLHCLCIVLFVSAALAAGFVPAARANGFWPISPDELKMTSEPKAPGAPAIILYREVDRNDSALTPYEYNYVRIKVLTEAGRRYADVEIPFYKESSSIDGIKARTIRPDGSVANFDSKVYEKNIIKSKQLKYLAKTFTLPDVQVGSIVEYYYTVNFTGGYIFDSRWILSNELYTRYAKFSLKPYQPSYDPWSVRWNWHDLPPGTIGPKQDPKNDILLEARDIPGFVTEDLMPPEDALKSSVTFVYSEGSVESDPDRFWRAVGKKRNGQLESFVGKHKEMEQAVAQIVSPSDSPEVKLQRIYARVQQLRNTSFEVEKTEQEQKRAKEKDNSNVADIWKRGYGDFYDITWLFLGLSRAAGLEAHGVWVASRSNSFFNPKLMDSRRLNEPIVLIKLNGKDTYFDPGAAFNPFGSLPWYETSVPGLQLDKDGGTWITTSLPASSESGTQRKATLKLSDTGDLEGKLTVTFTGLEALTYRVDERHEDEAARKKLLEDEVKAFIPAAAEVELTNKPDWTGSSPSMVAEFGIKIPGWASAAGRRVILPVGIFSAGEKHIFEHADRVHPICFPYPYQTEDDVTIELPLGWKVSSLPEPQKEDGHIIVYTFKAENSDGALHLRRTLNVDILQLDIKYYPSLRTFFQILRTADESQIVLQPGAAASSN